MADDEGGGAEVVGAHSQAPRRLPHEAVAGRQGGSGLGGRVPHEQAGGRGHVNEAADGKDVLNHVAGQPVERGDGIHPVVGGIVPATNATVRGDVEHVAGVRKAVDDV